MANKYNDARIRQGLAVLIEDSPIAPEFDNLTTTHIRPVEPRKPRPFVVAGLSAAAVLATFAVGTIWQLDRPAESPGPAVETPTTVVKTTATILPNLPAGVFPRVVLDAPDWSITYLDNYAGETELGRYATSDMQFSNGSANAELRMNSGWHADLDALVADRMNSAPRLADASVWDTSAVVVGEDASGFTAMFESNTVEFEFVAYDTDEETFRSLLLSLTQIAEQDWLAALPEEIVSDRAEVVPAYLKDVPLPPNFDAASLEEGPIEHWYPVAAETIGTVACEWIEVWIDAKATGDNEAVTQAVDAMATSHDWEVLAEMGETGDYPIVVWEYADAIAGDGTVVAGTVLTVEESYQQALGCSN